jgi:hypothetical protein
MAQRVTVHEECDRHLLLNGKSVEGETVTVGIDGVWYAIEACKQHTAKEIDPIRALVEELGRKLEGGTRDLNRLMKLAKEGVPATVTALPTAPAKEPAALRSVQPAQTTTVAKRNGKRAKAVSKGNKGRNICLWCEDKHFTTTTGLTLHLTAKHGLPKTMTEVFGLTCPQCGSYAEGGKLGIHLLKHKGKPTVTEAFITALNNGDKHGVAGPVFAKAQRISA